MTGLNKNQYRFVIIAAVVLFIINNIILGSIVPKLPGGSAFGITTMFTLVFVSLTVKKSGSVPIIYIVYGFIGAVSHLSVGDWMYVLFITALVLSAAGFAWFLNKFNYRLWTYFTGLPFFIIITRILNFAIIYFVKDQTAVPDTNIQTLALALLMGYSGIVLGYLVIMKLPLGKLE
jgi:hypothetical protein